ncbi:hypothetical protein HPB48_004319 [Haemaphysalis longicornis]|uniref:CUB domain-containing protein n=1 Tax=Haemaphysalis longicornis TaxID=44386 RepID=A0A9J6G389_HAELO|nr:hypothetical protein HPB48_004319 [Haemaphysalis longicornis]
MPEANVGSVSSPGYPDHYPSNRNCTWTLTVAAGKRIQLHLATVQMEHHPNCSFDYLKVIGVSYSARSCLSTHVRAAVTTGEQFRGIIDYKGGLNSLNVAQPLVNILRYSMG